MKKKIVTGMLCLCSLTLFAQEEQTYTIPAPQNGSGTQTVRATFTPRNGTGSKNQTIRITLTPKKTSGSGVRQEAWRAKQQQNENRLKDHDRQLAELKEHDTKYDAQTNARLTRIENVVFSKNGQNGSPRLQYPNDGYDAGTPGEYQNNDSRQRYNQNDHDDYTQRSRQYDSYQSNRSRGRNSRFDPDWIRIRNGRIAIGIGVTALIVTGVGLWIHHDNMLHKQNTYVSPAPTPAPSTPTQPTSGTGGPANHTTIP